jgi:hypothetical protein
MNRLLTTAAILLAALFLYLHQGKTDLVLAQPGAGEIWQVGRCYRVFPHDRDQFYHFRVLEAPSGQWVRVQPHPAPIKTPAMRPQAPLWLNANSQFAVQEWSCSD